MSGKTYVGMLREAKTRGFRIALYYLWLPHVQTAIARVRQRVTEGGHDIPKVDIERRFARSLLHLVEYYVPLADQWAIWNNETSPPKLMAESVSCSSTALRTLLSLP